MASTAKNETSTKPMQKKERLRVEIRFCGIQPNIVAFYAIRSAVMKHFWDVNIDGRETDEFATFDVYVNNMCIFQRKDSHSYPNISQMLREIMMCEQKLQMSSQKPPVSNASKGIELSALSGYSKDLELKPIDLSKMDVKSWLVNGKGFL